MIDGKLHQMLRSTKSSNTGVATPSQKLVELDRSEKVHHALPLSCAVWRGLFGSALTFLLILLIPVQPER